MVFLVCFFLYENIANLRLLSQILKKRIDFIHANSLYLQSWFEWPVFYIIKNAFFNLSFLILNNIESRYCYIRILKFKKIMGKEVYSVKEGWLLKRGNFLLYFSHFTQLCYYDLIFFRRCFSILLLFCSLSPFPGR